MNSIRNIRVLVLAANPCVNDSRVMKSAESLVQAGFIVQVICRKDAASPEQEKINAVTYRRVPMQFGMYYRSVPGNQSVKGLAISASGPVKRLFSSLGKLARKIIVSITGHAINNVIQPLSIDISDDINRYRPDVIHAHDLFTLPEAVRLSVLTGARLIYDAHELETRRNGLKPAGSWLIKQIEGKYIRRADAVITVSEQIADYMADEYMITKPVVVLNAPRMKSCRRDNGTIRGTIGLDTSSPLAVYVGSIVPGRGIDRLIDAMKHCPDYHVALLGPVTDSYQTALTKRAISAGVNSRLHYIDSVTPDSVINYIQSADIGVIPIQDTCLSYRYCMPNKLFEIIFAGLPVCVSALPCLEDFVKQEQVGLNMDERDPKDIARAMRELYDRKSAFRPGKDRLVELIDKYSWEQQGQTLTTIFRQVLDTCA